MFERYTERARRVLFFARYEASQLGSLSIDTEHLLLGLIREGKGLTSRIFARSHLSLETIRTEVERRTVFHEKLSTSVEIPFSVGAKRALECAAEESDRLLHNYIGTEHLLLGILRVEQSTATAILAEAGLRLDPVRQMIVELLSQGVAREDAPVPPGMTSGRPPTRIPDFVPSYDVHFMYGQAQGLSSVGGPRECSLCGFTLKAAIAKLWEADERRIDLPPALATYQRYDIVLKLPRDESRNTIHALMRQAIEKQFGVQIAAESRSTEVYVMTMPGGPGGALRSQPDAGGGAVGFATFSTSTAGGAFEPSLFPMQGFNLSGMPPQIVAQAIEEIVGRPVVDETGLSGVLDLELRATINNPGAFLSVLRDEAGLVLTAARREIPVLVVRQQ